MKKAVRVFSGVAGQAAAGEPGMIPMPWWGAHEAPIGEDCVVRLPAHWNVTGDFFLAWVPGASHLACWPRETHDVRVAQIRQADLSRYDEHARAELQAEASSNLVSRVEHEPSGSSDASAADAAATDYGVTSVDGAGETRPAFLEVTPEMGRVLCPQLPGTVTVLGLEDHFELWNRQAFQEYVEGIDLSSYCE